MQGFDDCLNQLNIYNERYNRLCELLTFEEVLVDKKLFLKLTLEKRELEDLVQMYIGYKKLESELCDLNELKDLTSGEEEYLSIENNIKAITTQIDQLKLEMIGKLAGYKAEQERICVEIVVGRGASAAQLMQYLKDVYLHWCENRGYDCSCQGLKSNTSILIVGNGVRDVFSSEIGSHEASDGEKSCCYVFVYEMGNIVEYEFSDDEITIEICRSSGAGGQHINTTDSAVRVTHLPTGITAICQDERNQLQNKAKAIERLKEKVKKTIAAQNEESIQKQKKPQISKLKSAGSVRVYDLKNNAIIQDNDKFTLKDFEKGLLIRK